MIRPHPATSTIRAVLHDLIRPGLQEPHALKITTIGTHDLPVFEIHVASRDMGRIIGKHGNNFLALNTLVRAMGIAQGIPCRATAADPPPAPAKPRHEAWDITIVQRAIADLLAACKLPSAVSIAPERTGRHLVIIANPLPEDIAIPLAKWLNVMGVEGGTRLILDEPAATL